MLALEFIVLFSFFRFHLSFPIEIALLFLIIFPLLSQLRRERIAERIRALQELVPSVNKVSVFPLANFIIFLAEWGCFLHSRKSIWQFILASFVGRKKH